MSDNLTHHSPREQSATCADDADFATLLESMDREEARHRAEGLKMLAGWRTAIASQRKVGKIAPAETVAEKPAVPLGEMAGSTAPETGTPVRSKTPTKHPSTKSGKSTRAIALDDVRLGVRSTKRNREGIAPYDALTSGGLIVVEHETLRALGPALGFTLGLRSDVAEKAIASGNVAQLPPQASHLSPGPRWASYDVLVHDRERHPHDRA